jgi:hypothetical protein
MFAMIGARRWLVPVGDPATRAFTQSEAQIGLDDIQWNMNVIRPDNPAWRNLRKKTGTIDENSAPIVGPYRFAPLPQDAVHALRQLQQRVIQAP